MRVSVALCCLGSCLVAEPGLIDVPAAEAEPLRLIAKVGDATVAEFVATGESVGNTAVGAVPPEATWTLEGDLRAHASSFLLAPKFRIVRAPSFGTTPPLGALDYATVTVNRGEAWTDAQLRDATVFFIWAVEQRPVAVKPVQAKVHEKWPGSFAAMAAFELPPEARSGVPWVVLWKNGRFVPVPSPFALEAANRALTELHFGSPEDFERALAQPKVVAARTREERLTLLHFASAAGNMAATDALLRAGADVEAGAAADGTALHSAAEKGRIEVVAALLDAGARNARRTPDRTTPARSALLHGHVEVAVRFAGALDADDTAELARRAAFQGDHATIRALIAQGNSNVVARLPAGVLARGLELRRPELVRTLLQGGLRIEAKDQGSLMLAAAAQTDPTCVELLADVGAAADAAGEGGVTALMVAASLAHRDTAAALLQRGARADAVDRHGRTALHYAVLAGDPELVAMLVPHVPLLHRDHAQKSALDYALEMQAASVVDRLLAAGAHLDPAHPGFEIGLEHAIALDLPALLQAALTAGWDPQGTLREGWLPADVARHCGARQVLALLGEDPESRRLPATIERKPDKPPTLVRGTKPPDLRTKLEAPAASVEVMGIIDTAGRFRFPRITSSSDPQLAHSVLQTVSGYEMRPAEKAGGPVATQTKLVFNYEAKSSAVHAPGPGIQVPVALQTVAPEPSQRTNEFIGAPVTHTTFVPVFDPVTRQVTYRQSGNVLPPERRPVTESTPGWATATVIVERDGRPGPVQVIDASDSAFAEAATKALRGYTFSPAHKGAIPGRVRLTLVVTVVPE